MNPVLREVLAPVPRFSAGRRSFRNKKCSDGEAVKSKGTVMDVHTGNGAAHKLGVQPWYCSLRLVPGHDINSRTSQTCADNEVTFAKTRKLDLAMP